MSTILAVDPGYLQSAYVLFDGKVRGFGIEANVNMRDVVRHCDADRCAIEMVRHYGTGMAVGMEVFGTCVWIGRFIELWWARGVLEAKLVERKTIVRHFCGTDQGKDANVRQSIIDRYGGKEAAIGRKAAPGPLYGVTADAWAALALALHVYDLLPARIEA